MSKAAPKTATARYWLLERVAQGGMAELFKARVVGPEGFDKLVAVKRILPTFSSNEEFVKMFIDEARLAANLNHPNIVQVFELGRDVDENLFISMELVPGVELGTMLEKLAVKRKRMPEAASLEIIIQMLRGLHHAHNKSDLKGHPLHLVHRDVSPQNVLVTSEGVAKLLDFGVAKAKGRLTETQAGLVKGKLIYMSPEQSRNKPIDARSDQYAAGLVLWECLAGEPCYNFATEVELLRAVGYGEARHLEELGIEVEPELESVLMTALAPKPDDRFENCEEFANALLRYKQRTYPSYTPTMLGKLVNEVAGKDVARVAAIPDLEGKKAIPLKVAEVEVSNISGGGGSGRGKVYALIGGGVGLAGLLAAGGAVYYNASQPPPDSNVVVVQAGPSQPRVITYTKVVEKVVEVKVPAVDPDAGDADGGEVDAGDADAGAADADAGSGEAAPAADAQDAGSGEAAAEDAGSAEADAGAAGEGAKLEAPKPE